MDGDDGVLIGRVLEDRYRIDRALAQGGMSTVYAGVDLRLDRPVAIKVMTPQYAADPSFLIRFEREARAAAKLDNPHVVGVFDQGRDGDWVFLIMELVDGGTLRDLLRERRKLSPRVALAVLEGVLTALAAAHRAGLIHRDVKPENVLISYQGEVKVADFGLVRAVTSTTAMTGDVILGTVAYLSPEQVETGASDERSDVYSAGVLAYEMLTGAPPFVGDNALSVAYQHVHSTVPSVLDNAPEVASAVADVIDAATRSDPADRPRDGDDFLRRLRGARLQTGLSLATVPVPRSPGDSAAGSKTRVADSARSGGQRAGGRTAIQPASNRPDKAPAPPPSRTTVQLDRARRRRTRLIGVGVLLAVTVLAVVLGIWLANRFVSPPATEGKIGTAAAQAVAEAGLTPVVTTEYNNAVTTGRVVAMDPPADTELRRGDDVTLTISGGKPVVPAIEPGLALPLAETALRSVTLVPVTDPKKNVYDDNLTEGSVVETLPPAGETVLVGSSVLLVLSKGPAPQTVPQVAGKLAEDAENKLLVEGFTLAPQQTEFDANVPAGTVLGTDPAAGEERPRGTPVAVIVADSVTVPEVLPGAVDAVVAALEDEGFEVTVGTPVFDASVPGGDAVRIEPAEGTRIDPDDPAVTVIGSTSVAVPPLAGLTVRQAEDALTEVNLVPDVRALIGAGSASVTGQQPDANTLVAPGSVVHINAWP